ncbi:hypothetical protein [Roseibacillus persicicus]|uniref:Serine protease n=1 Tax=Roseibacillus persicicus TaxID=454148 RepID=A0A918WQT7_9BACT|nr:hypothetical protein [Roseibacillus persicicus]GHC67713.1 hypothetical protein GCM10007100_39760 [Roseibacillus persicicus]
MIRALLVLPFLSLIGGCNPNRESVTLGEPANRALRTAELADDANRRLKTLEHQTPLTSNSLFTRYQKRSVSQWNSGWTRRIDFTGVSWSHRQAGTAVTPRHLVFAAHYPLKVGTSLTFHDRAGMVVSRKIEKLVSFRNRKEGLRADVAVALLDRALPPSIKTYRLLPPREDYSHTLPGCPVLVTEQGRRVFLHQVRSVSKNSISFTKNADYPEKLYKGLITGDSGNPSFLLVGGEPVLIETHTGGGPGSGPFYSGTELFRELERTIAELDPSYRLKTVPLDPQVAPAPPKKTPESLPRKTPTVTRVPQSPTSKPSTVNPEPNKPRLPRVRRVPPPNGSE